MYVELSFKFKFKSNKIEINEDFIDHFVVDFVEKNGLLCGGGSSMTFYDPKENTEYNKMKMMLTEYLSNYNHLVNSIIIRNYDEELDEFIDLEEIFF